MKLIHIALFLSLVLGIGFFAVASGGPLPEMAAKIAAPVTKQDSDYLNQPFDIQSEKLPLHFRGADAFKLYYALDKAAAGLTKSEYETTEQYTRRIEPLLSAPLLGNLSFKTPIAFVLSLPARGLLYDADKQVMDFSLGYSSNKEIYLSDLYGSNIVINGTGSNSHFMVFNKIKSVPQEYIGSNAFGVSAKITKSSSDEYGVLLCRSNSAQCGQVSKASFMVKLPLSEAQQAKEAAIYVLIGHLRQSSPVMVSRYHHAPELTEPNDEETIQHVINFEPSALWLANAETGEVYKKIKLKQ